MQTREFRTWHLAGALLSLVAVSLMLFRLSDAAFSATTSNTGNQLAAGDVVLTDDDAGSMMFNVSGMKPGTTATECIQVTYSGSLDASVKLYGSLAGGTGLAEFLDLSVYRGSGGSSADCTGFVSAETVFTGTLEGFLTSAVGFATGLGTWTPTGGAPADTVTYSFVVTLQDNNNAQGLTSSPTFTWEAQNV